MGISVSLIKKGLKTKNQGQFIIAVLKVLEVKVVLVLRYLHYLRQKRQKQISDKIQQISDIFQQNISDKFPQTNFPMIKSGKSHFGHIQAYFFGQLKHVHPVHLPFSKKAKGQRPQ